MVEERRVWRAEVAQVRGDPGDGGLVQTSEGDTVVAVRQKVAHQGELKEEERSREQAVSVRVSVGVSYRLQAGGGAGRTTRIACDPLLE